MSDSADERSEDDRMLTLVSRNGETFQLPRSAAIASGFVSQLLHLGDEEEEDQPESFEQIDVPRVNGECLGKVVEFLIHYAKHPLPEIKKPLEGNSFREIITDEWYQNFVSPESIRRNMLFEVVAAANFMDIKPLLDLACLWCTFELTGLNAEQIRVILNFPTMSAEEEARAREEHPWIFEETD